MAVPAETLNKSYDNPVVESGVRLAFEQKPPEADENNQEDKELQEVPLEEEVREEVDKTTKEVTDILVEAETKPDDNPVKEVEQPVETIKINVIPGSANREIQEQKPVAVETKNSIEQPAVTSETETKIEINKVPEELPVVESVTTEPVAEKIPVANVAETPEVQETLPVPEVPIQPVEAQPISETVEKPEVLAEKEKIDKTFEDIGRRILKGWQEDADIDELTGGICYAIENYRTDTGDKSFDFFNPTIQALDTVSKQLMIVEESGKAGKRIELKNPAEAKGVFTVTETVLKDLPKLGQENREKLRDFLYVLGERLDNRSIEDQLVTI